MRWGIGLLVVSLILSTYEAEAGSVRLRLREHFDYTFVNFGDLDESAEYWGLSNTVNLWWEEPFHFAIGLAFNPVLGGSNLVGSDAPAGTGDGVRFWHIGTEAKYFFLHQKKNALKSLFGRLGVFYNIFDTDGPVGNLNGASVYLGAGYEFKVWKIGIAPEMAFRGGWLENSTRFFQLSPSVGVHFYVF